MDSETTIVEDFFSAAKTAKDKLTPVWTFFSSKIASFPNATLALILFLLVSRCGIL